MTPMFKTGTRRYLIRYSIMVNGEEYPKQIIVESQNELHAKASLAARMAPGTEFVIASIQRI
ncbi:MAG TPA: hypothetical protein PKE03_10105 [Bacteroidales bacterium]|nr:hypothetical protein [Bacteroidales bacterium]